MDRAGAIVFEYAVQAAATTPISDKQKIRKDSTPFVCHGARASFIVNDAISPLNGQLVPVNTSQPALLGTVIQGYQGYLNFFWQLTLSDNAKAISNKLMPSDVLEVFFNKENPIEFDHDLELNLEVTPMAPAVSGRLFITLLGCYRGK